MISWQAQIGPYVVGLFVRKVTASNAASLLGQAGTSITSDCTVEVTMLL